MLPIETAPLRLLVLADLHASREQAAPRELTDAADFQRLLETLAPAVRVDVPNLLGAAASSLDVELTLTSLRDLTPAGLLEQVPALEPARLIVELLGRKEATAADLAAALSAPGLERLRQVLESSVPPAAAPAQPVEPPAAPAQGDALNRILNLVDVPSAEDRASSAVGSVVSAIGRQRGTVPTPSKVIQESILAAVGRQLDEILHHPEVQALEADWRGLRFLLNRTDLRQALRLHVLHAPRTALLEDGLLDRIQAGQEGAGPDLVLCAANLGDPVADATVAEHLGELAAELRAALVFSVGLPFFGPPGQRGELALSSIRLEPPEYVCWRALRQKEPARWLGAISNRFLLRAPYGREDGNGGLAYAENTDRDEDYLWGDPVWLVGVLAFRSFVRLGWPTEITGSPAGRIDDLPVRALSRSGRPGRTLPLERFLSMDEVEQLAHGGFIGVCATEDTDAALLLAAPPLFHQPAPGRRSGLFVGWPYQVAVGRVVRLVERWRSTMIGRPAEEQRSDLETRLRELAAGTGPLAKVTVSLMSPATADEAPQMRLELQLGGAVLGGVRLELRFVVDR